MSAGAMGVSSCSRVANCCCCWEGALREARPFPCAGLYRKELEELLLFNTCDRDLRPLPTYLSFVKDVRFPLVLRRLGTRSRSRDAKVGLFRCSRWLPKKLVGC